MQIKSYQDLKVWQQSMQLAEECYQVTRQFPKEELFAMTSQIRRAAASIPANIAEGWGREGTREYIQYLRVAQGSLKELETLLLLSQRVGLLAQHQLHPLLSLLTDVGKMMHSLIGSLRRKLK